ncbi:programmed cell death protein 2-like isoform 2-T2 [Pelodytes ibericus]
MAQSSSGQPRVLLGFKDAPLEDNTSSWEVSKIGGVPNFPPRVTLISPPCPLCSAALCHVTQIYCPLEGSVFHRVIHVFACSGKQCWGKHESWVALRSQSIEKTEPPQTEQALFQQEESLAATDWCDGADNWGLDDDNDLTGASPMLATDTHAKSVSVPPLDTDCTAQLQALSLADRLGNAGCWVSAFCSYYMAVGDEEEFELSSDHDHVHRLLREYEKQEGILSEEQESCTGKGDMEKYEKHNLRSHDIVFYKFLKKIEPCRQQILRYSWNGTPLYISPTEVGFQPPPCVRCGGRRVFECQLMPALVCMLQSTKADVFLEFGTVLIFTCERSCWADGEKTPVQEFCFVQEDPDQQYFK